MNEQHVVSRKIYIAVFAALIALTLTTIAVASVDLGPLNAVAALVIAALKGSLVVLFFMHVRYSKPLTGLVIFAALLWLVILIGLTLADFVSRSWIPSPRPW